VESLLNEGTSTDATNTQGQTALHLAVVAGHHDAILLLLGRGAPLLGLNKTGESLLHVAVTANRPEITELLLALGLPAGLADAKKQTALDLAHQLNAPEMVQALLHPRPVDIKAVQQEIATHCRVTAVKLEDAAVGLVLAPDGRRGWVFTPRSVIEFDAVTGEPRRIFTNTPSIVAVGYHESPANNGTLQILKADGIISLDLLVGRFSEIAHCRSDLRLSPLGDAALSADGRYWWLISKESMNSCDGLVPPVLSRADLTTGELRQLVGPVRNPTNGWVYVPIPHPYVERAPWLISADGGRRIFVSSLTPGTVSVFRADGDKPVREIAVPHTPVLMECTADGRLVTVATKELAVTDTDTGKLLHRVPLAGKPTALCVDAAGANAFVASDRADMVQMVNLQTGRITRGIEVVRPLGTSDADAARGRSLCGIVQLRWADQPRRLIGLGYSGHVLFVARY
jgi:hypothetical protein